MKSAFILFGFLVFFLLFISCTPGRVGFSSSNKISSDASKQDIKLLKSILEKNHPSLYWYTTKDSVDTYFEVALASVKDSLTELQLKNKIAWVISKLHCGHTAVRSSKSYTNYFAKRRPPQFPLSLKVWKDSMVIINSSIRNSSELKRGTVVTGINAFNNRMLLDSMFKFISTDGYSDNFKQQIISFNFPFYYANTFGLDSQYRIRYIDSYGRQQTTLIKNFVNRRDTGAKKMSDSLPTLTRREFREFRSSAKRSLQIDTALSTAIMRLSTFSDAGLKGFFRKSFKKLKQDQIQHFVIDIRENGGGDIMSSTRLTQYLVNQPFHVADTVAAVSRSFPYRRYIHPWFVYWMTMHLTGRKHADRRIHFNYFENHSFKPKKNTHFNGNIYVVQGGYSFSAATLFAGALKGQRNVTLVGEETGGGSYGNTAMHLPVVQLPNSKIRVILPLYRIVVSRNRVKTGRGIFPDVEVPPSSYAIKSGVDLKMEKVRELIIKRK